MQIPLVLAGLAMGLAASPHCAAMCGAPCAGLTAGCGRNAGGFHLGRLLGYMGGGAVAAGSMALLGAWSVEAPAIRPLWILLHLALLGLGLFWLVTGRHVPAMARRGAVPGTVRVIRSRPWRSGLAGLGWVAWPCPALQTALLLAALADAPQGGALVMGGFALGSMPALAVAPWIWTRLSAVLDAAGSPALVSAAGLRLAGTGLVATSGWALTRGVWPSISAWCGF